jgi:hypothetical protein
VNLTNRFDVSVATKLLRDNNLVWSPDFDVIRLPLANLLESMASALEVAAELTSSIDSVVAND